MNFVLVAHGNDPIPPTGWGAVEQVIWQHTLRLRAGGHHVELVNSKKWPAIATVVKLCLFGKVDVVHCHAEKPVKLLASFVRILNQIRGGHHRILLVSTTHNPLNPEKLDSSELKALRRCNMAPYHLILREDVQPLIHERNPAAICAVLPNGVETSEFSTAPDGNGKACYVGRIQERKRQNDTAILLEGSGIACDFIGPIREEVPISDALQRQMVGEWDRETLHKRLCEYSCLVLISQSEGQPLVVVEAMAAGLPVVISPACTGNLDLSKPFIHVVHNDDELVPAIRAAIAQRTLMTEQIRTYAKATFDYDSIVAQYVGQLQVWREVQ